MHSPVELYFKAEQGLCQHFSWGHVSDKSKVMRKKEREIRRQGSEKRVRRGKISDPGQGGCRPPGGLFEPRLERIPVGTLCHASFRNNGRDQSVGRNVKGGVVDLDAFRCGPLSKALRDLFGPALS